MNKSFLGHKGLKIAGKLEVKAEGLKSCAQICVCQPWLMRLDSQEETEKVMNAPREDGGPTRTLLMG